MDWKTVSRPASSRPSPVLTFTERLTSSGLSANVILLSDDFPKSLQPNTLSSYRPSCCSFSFHRSPSICLLLSPLTRREVHEGRMSSVLPRYIPDAQSTVLMLAGAQHKFVQWMDKWLPAIQGDFSPSKTSGAGIIHFIHLAAHRPSG